MLSLALGQMSGLEPSAPPAYFYLLSLSSEEFPLQPTAFKSVSGLLAVRTKPPEKCHVGDVRS